VPIVFITGYSDEEIKKKAKKLKPLAYISKPFDIEELAVIIKEV